MANETTRTKMRELRPAIEEFLKTVSYESQTDELLESVNDRLTEILKDKFDIENYDVAVDVKGGDEKNYISCNLSVRKKGDEYLVVKYAVLPDVSEELTK